ncbi:MAG TPA: ABC transporter permease [Bryobacteraceae bacterium]|nr:ABC transporter permease [Bryobacteraceae bacterium]
MFGAIVQDLHYGLRSFRRTPAVALTAVVTIALGIGASAAVFSVVDRILFRALPYPDADRLVSVGMLAPVADTNEFLMAPVYLRFRERQTAFSGMAGFAFISDCDLTEPNPLRLRCARVDAPFLATFGIRPAVGRGFSEEDDLPGAPASALLTYGFWMRRFAGDPGVVGRSIPLDGRPAAIIGVLPRDFELFNLSPVDLLLPAGLAGNQAGRAVRAFARLKPGVTVQRARAALAPLFDQERNNVPAQFRQGLSLVVRPLRDRQIATVRSASWTLLCAVTLVLLMACANVANLLLVRSAARRRELAIRHALGAGRARLVRQALTESLLLAGAGALAGCSLAWALLRFFIAVAPDGITRLDQAAVDGRVLLFAVAVSIAAGLLFGLAPALERRDAEALTGGRSIVSLRGLLRHSLIAAQIAASLVLLTGAGVLLRNLRALEHVSLGMEPEHAVAAHIVLGRSYTPVETLAFFEGLESRLDRLPGSVAAISSSIPPYGGVGATPYSALNVEGRERLPEGAGAIVAWRHITPGYFEALGIPIVRGRGFNQQDRGAGAAAIVLSQTLARRLFPGEDPVGRRIFQSANGQWRTVVGVAGDVRNNGLTEPPIAEYYAVRKHAPEEASSDDSGWRAASIVVRSRLAPRDISGAIRAAIAELAPTLPVNIQTMAERVSSLTAQPRFNALLLGGFAAVGLLLAAIGIYGVIAFLVGQRAPEIGIRMALGASPSDVARLFLLHAARWTAAGLGLGLAGSLVVTRLLGSPRDRASLAAAAAVLSAVALAAAWLPSRRAARIDPVQTLR